MWARSSARTSMATRCRSGWRRRSSTGMCTTYPVLLGCTADEATVLMGDPSRVTAEHFHATLQRKYPDDQEALLALRRAARFAPPRRWRAFALTTLANMRFFASVLQRVNASPVYFYRFAHAMPCEDAAFFGAFHTSEIPYCFANLDRTPYPMAAEDEALSGRWRSTEPPLRARQAPGRQGPGVEPYTMQDDKLMSLDCPCAFEGCPTWRSRIFCSRFWPEKCRICIRFAGAAQALMALFFALACRQAFPSKRRLNSAQIISIIEM